MAWGAGDRLEGLAHAEALAFTIVRVVEHDPQRRRAPRRPGRQDLWKSKFRRDVVLVTASARWRGVDFHTGQGPARPRGPPEAHVAHVAGH